MSEKKGHQTHEKTCHHKACSFLTRFGYLSSAERIGKDSSEGLDQALCKFQKFYGLAETGRLDEETLKQMGKPRCGNSDESEGPQSAAAQFRVGPCRYFIPAGCY